MIAMQPLIPAPVDRRLRLGALMLVVLLAAPAAAAGTSDGDTAAAASAAASAPTRQTVLPVPPTGPVPSRAALVRMVDRAAARHGVEPDLVHAVVRAESGYDPHAVSRAGAVGLMQVMPATATDYGVHSVDALFDPQTNLRTGVRHLKRLLARYGIGKAVMAYNAGEGALERGNGFVSYAETQRYTHRVLTSYLGKKGIAPYSAEARRLTGVILTPAMAKAGGGSRPLRSIDASRLSLRVRPTLSSRALDPAAHSIGPDSKPMFVLEPRRD
jgi:soluble lytic murein transglycosylase-like protein